jgi:hypothetical protein
MPAKIEVENVGPDQFRVRVIERETETSHLVSAKKADCERISAGKIEPAELIRRSFEFLLENEPKESILARFDLSVIARYFPSFEQEMRRRLSAK